jgi:hypothetical protein
VRRVTEQLADHAAGVMGCCEPMSVQMADCVIVRAYGRQLDQLRGEASRIARGSKIDWWIERDHDGARFCFENAETKKTFASICENLAVQCIEA